MKVRLLQSNWPWGTYLPQLSLSEHLSVSLMYVCAPSLLTLAAPVWNAVSWFVGLLLYKATKSTVMVSILLAYTFHNIQSKLWVLSDTSGQLLEFPKALWCPAVNWKDNFTSLVASQARSYSPDLYTTCTTIAQANVISSSIKSAGINITQRVLLNLQAIFILNQEVVPGWNVTREKTE